MSNKRIIALKKEITQLQVEQKQKRLPVSSSGKELVNYICQNQDADYLITKDGMNPFKVKQPCPIF